MRAKRRIPRARRMQFRVERKGQGSLEEEGLGDLGLSRGQGELKRSGHSGDCRAGRRCRISCRLRMFPVPEYEGNRKTESSRNGGEMRERVAFECGPRESLCAPVGVEGWRVVEIGTDSTHFNGPCRGHQQGLALRFSRFFDAILLGHESGYRFDLAGAGPKKL